MDYKIADGHTDMLLNFNRDKDFCFNKNNKNFHVDLPKLKEANIALEVFAVFIEDGYFPENALKRTLHYINIFRETIASKKDIVHIKDSTDIIRAEAENKISAVLSLEGADAVTELSQINSFYNLGVRLITLTWNRRNMLADGLTVNSGGGLTDLGKKAVELMNQLKITIDLSHISQEGFWDIIDLSSKPVVASHSNVKKIRSIERNLDDSQIRAVAKNGGLIGINFCPQFLNTSAADVDGSDIIKHIDYIVKLAGIESVALGSDYDGITNTPVGFENIGKLQLLAEKLNKNGYKSREIEKILYLNWRRVFLENL
ncbi:MULTISPECIES: dipeptidase [unclassified Halanaerobium]|uniref:dipeptidase n=1 Tax=unclassified Halanaerobium TaxID=2641197 RepID=UPI000DF14E5D|nr:MULTISPECIES: dipeptidase [unclassified Halanaerobium]RCW51508.1 dipeptidase [Halanaerobium sp. MA284_MarDTE_T2]RCW89296.1 dipeptidase [Halanaerobium sp. DL-01]